METASQDNGRWMSKTQARILLGLDHVRAIDRWVQQGKMAHRKRADGKLEVFVRDDDPHLQRSQRVGAALDAASSPAIIRDVTERLIAELLVAQQRAVEQAQEIGALRAQLASAEASLATVVRALMPGTSSLGSHGNGSARPQIVGRRPGRAGRRRPRI